MSAAEKFRELGNWNRRSQARYALTIEQLQETADAAAKKKAEEEAKAKAEADAKKKTEEKAVSFKEKVAAEEEARRKKVRSQLWILILNSAADIYRDCFYKIISACPRARNWSDKEEEGSEEEDWEEWELPWRGRNQEEDGRGRREKEEGMQFY